MKGVQVWTGGLILLSLGCAASQALPTIDIQRAVELTVTAISATLASNTPVPPSPLPATDLPSPPPATGQIIDPPDFQGCSITGPRLETGLVTRVIDGDTIDVNIDGEVYPVRYIGIDSPETGQPFWPEGRAANQVLVANEVVTLVRDVSDRDSFDRLLRYVFLFNGTFVNEELVRQGFARAVAYPPDTACENRFNQAEQVARARKAGLWAEVPATETPTPTVSDEGILVDPACSQFNAPGDDNNAKNEEYVCLKNPGGQALDLTGWAVEDEYGWLYTFPSFSLEPGSSLLLHTGCGTDTAEDLYWCRTDTAIWNNNGDCVRLKDDMGELVQEYCY